MKSNIIKFPKQFRKSTPLGVAIKLYSEEEIHVVLFCLNLFGDNEQKYSKKDLRSLDPIYALECLRIAKGSSLLSYEAKTSISFIMKNVTHDVTPSNMGVS